MRTAAFSRLALSMATVPNDLRISPQAPPHRADDIIEKLEANEPGLMERVNRATFDGEVAGLRWITPADDEWPTGLHSLDKVDEYEMPLGLWVRGEANLRTLTEKAVAVVGSRSCSTYGAEVAGNIAFDLAQAGFTVISGAAYGIDACAHRGALSAARPTVAVLPSGADRAYPVAHTALLDRIAEEGLVVSEYPPGSTPTKSRFLERNRITAALSQAVVIGEAASRSGSLNVGLTAHRLGRPVFAVPGPVTSRRSDGGHDAIRSHWAELATSALDVIDWMNR